MSKKSSTFVPDLKSKSIITKNYLNTQIIMKKFGTINYIEVNDGKTTAFASLLEKQLFVQTHPDAKIHGNYAVEPLYMLVDIEETGFCLTPKHAVTYNESLEIIKHYL